MNVIGTSSAISWMSPPATAGTRARALHVPSLRVVAVGKDALRLDALEQAIEEEANRVTAPLWLDEVYAGVAAGDIDAAMDLVFDRIDGHLIEGHFESVDDLLAVVDLGALDTNLVVGFLTATLSAADRLPRRVDFVKRAREALARLAPERVERLIAGLD